MKIGFYAITVGPAAMLKLIADAAVARGHEVVIGERLKPVPDNQLPEFQQCDVVLIGTSSLGIEEELKLVQTLPPTTKIVVVEDVPGSSLRPRAKEILDRVSMVIVAMPQWVKTAEEFGYARACYLGPPAHWKTSYDAMTRGRNRRAEFRKRCPGLEHPLAPDDVVFFYGGIKEHLLNNRILRVIAEAGQVLLGDRFVLCFKNHPGEPNDLVAFAERTAILEGHWVLAAWNGLTLPEIVKSVDVPIFTSGATDSIVAAYARLPALYYTDELVREYRVSIGSPEGRWFVADLGGVMTINGPSMAEAAIRRFLSPEGKQYLRKKQETNFPLPESWDSAPRIIEFVESPL